MSWPMHQRFDGLYGGVPSIAIRFREIISSDQKGNISGYDYLRTQVSVIMEFRQGDHDTPTAIKPFLSENHSYDSSSNEFKLILYVIDPNKFQMGLNRKYMITIN